MLQISCLRDLRFILKAMKTSVCWVLKRGGLVCGHRWCGVTSASDFKPRQAAKRNLPFRRSASRLNTAFSVITCGGSTVWVSGGNNRTELLLALALELTKRLMQPNNIQPTAAPGNSFQASLWRLLHTGLFFYLYVHAVKPFPITSLYDSLYEASNAKSHTSSINNMLFSKTLMPQAQLQLFSPPVRRNILNSNAFQHI
jgi:hypothetical protein